MKLKISNLSKYFDEQLVFQDLNMVMDEGNIYGIKGDNGAGKSTLFRILAGFEKQTSGQVTYDDKMLDESIMRKITCMHQKPYMMKTSVEKNILYPIKIRKRMTKEDVEKCHEMMNELDLYRFRNKKAWKLSGGEIQKVSLARALIFEPEVLLMDEPTAHVDKRTVKIIEKMVIKRQENTKMITAIVTHDTPIINDLFNHVYHF